MNSAFKTISIQHPRIVFWLGVAGIMFYALGPLLFPDAPLRQPELLPVYTLMIGLGKLLSEDRDKTNGVDNSDDNES